MSSTLERFIELFTGGTQAYGEWDVIKKAKTIHRAPELENYQSHLEGKVGLGLVPVQLNGMCRFAAIDIDVDTIDHNALFTKIEQRNIPINVCRSKSGGAHLYLFIRKELPAQIVRDVLKRWATVLGYPQVEIFPKQVKVSKENIGNWINLPYFGGDNTTRYAVGPAGALSLEEFLDTAKYYDPDIVTQVDESVDSNTAKMPPCLAALTQNGIGEGMRNQAMFNFAVFYRKARPGDWETALQTHNSQYLSPPLDFRELQGVVQSCARTKYQYLCDQSPLKENCDREQCLKLPFGINNKPWDEAGSYDDFTITHLRKLLTDPPRYVVEVNGRDITLDWDSLYTYRLLKSAIGSALDIVAPPKKQPQWEQKLRGLLATKEDIDAPEDASQVGLVLDRFHEFLGLRDRAQNKEDLLRGIPVEEGGSVLFRVGDLRRYLQGWKLDRIEGSELFMALRKDGCTHKRIRLNGRLVQIWSYPLERINEQTHEFAVANFKRDMEKDEM